MQQVFSIPKSMKMDFRYTFCPGCDHGIVIRLVAEVIDELGIREDMISSTSVGCSVFLYDFLNIDCVEAPHGRALASATGVKRARPDKVVFTYSGDGDFASIGIAESLHTALRGEKITSLCINNTTYGMTGGQLGPTTLMGQVTTTSPQEEIRIISGTRLRLQSILLYAMVLLFRRELQSILCLILMMLKKLLRKLFKCSWTV